LKPFLAKTAIKLAWKDRGPAHHLTLVEASSRLVFFGGEKIIQNPARRKEDFDRKSRSKGEALREMAGKTGGWVKNDCYPHRRRAMGIGHFSSPGWPVEKNFGERSS
jgi:hypothetical protein